MKVMRLRWWKIKNGGVHVSWMTLSRHHKARASNAPRKRLKHVRTDHQSFCQQPKSKLTETDSISSCYYKITRTTFSSPSRLSCRDRQSRERKRPRNPESPTPPAPFLHPCASAWLLALSWYNYNSFGERKSIYLIYIYIYLYISLCTRCVKWDFSWFKMESKVATSVVINEWHLPLY